jgi:hypothetical protein
VSIDELSRFQYSRSNRLRTGSSHTAGVRNTRSMNQ